LQTLLIAGTSAQVGKTVVLSALMAYWQRYKTSSAGVIKPLDFERLSQRSEPAELDCERFKRLFNLAQPVREITPVLLRSAVLPPIEATTGDPIDFEQLWQTLQQSQQRHELVLLEAFGGLGTPLTFETTMADLAWDWRIPTVLVVPVQPNLVADAVTNVALANQSRLHLKGIILNELPRTARADPDNQADRDLQEDLQDSIELIQSLTRKPVLGYIPRLDPNSLPQLTRAAAGLALEQILPGLELLRSSA
jgi:dethiobiotin synthetase